MDHNPQHPCSRCRKPLCRPRAPPPRSVRTTHRHLLHRLSSGGGRPRVVPVRPPRGLAQPSSPAKAVEHLPCRGNTPLPRPAPPRSPPPPPAPPIFLPVPTPLPPHPCSRPSSPRSASASRSAATGPPRTARSSMGVGASRGRKRGRYPLKKDCGLNTPNHMVFFVKCATTYDQKHSVLY